MPTRTAPPATLAEHPHALSLGDIAASIELKTISPTEAPAIAAARGVFPDAIGGRQPPPLEQPPAAPYPAYLAGRFGPSPTLWLLEPLEARRFEPGCLVYLGAETPTPDAAIGVIVAPTVAGERGTLALLGKVPVATGDQLIVRDTAGIVPVRVAERAEARRT